MNSPPIGVIMPSCLIPVAASTYRLPEKIREPTRSDQPATWSAVRCSAARGEQAHGQNGQGAESVVLRGGLKDPLGPLGRQGAKLITERFESILESVRAERADRHRQEPPDRTHTQPE